MNAKLINYTIGEMCKEIAPDEKIKDWRQLSEESLLKEAAMCIFSSQLRFEISEAVANKLHKDGFFKIKKQQILQLAAYQDAMVLALSAPILLELDGKIKHTRPRFKNRWALLVTNTVRNIYSSDLSIKKFLKEASCSLQARRVLVEHISGFGPKQASLFLRRIGYCSNLAVLDTHIVDYLAISKGMTVKQSSLSSLSFYEKTEKVFNNIALDFGYPVGAVDLATWITMRVAKREKMICLS